MTDLRFLLAFLTVPLMGYVFLNRPAFRSLHWASRFGLAACFGMLGLCSEMLLLTLLGVRWSLWLLICPAVLSIVYGLRPQSGEGPGSLRSCGFSLVLLVLTFVATAYAAGTARATSADLLFFWGPKGQRFAQAGGIDAAFLRDPDHLLMHPDYPPMLPCLYAWATLVAGGFAWGAAPLLLPLFLAFATLTFFGFARRTLGPREATEHTGLLTTLLAFVMVAAYTAGNAEPVLVFFEVVALSSLLFASDRPEGAPAAALALAGAALTKAEGVVFAALVIAGDALFTRAGRPWRRLVLVAGAPALALGAWTFFCHVQRVPAAYDLRQLPRPTLFHASVVAGEVVHQATYGFWFAPWVALGLLWPLGKHDRSSLLPLTVALGFCAFILYTYLTSSEDPRLWIAWSASRLLISPLVCLFFCVEARTAGAGAASSVDRSSRPSARQNDMEQTIHRERNVSPLR